MIPEYGNRFASGMLLRTVGALMDAASFVVAAQLLINWTAIEQNLPTAFDIPIFLGGTVLFLLLAVGGVCTFFGERISIRMALDFETSSLSSAIVWVQALERRGKCLDSQQKRDLFFSAPRFMARTVLQLVGVGSSIALVIAGVVVCSAIDLGLSGMIGLIIILSSPVFVYQALHSTRVGHMFRETAPNYMIAKKKILADGLNSDLVEREQLLSELRENSQYTSFLEAYGRRLFISPATRLAVSVVMALCVIMSLIIIGNSWELDQDGITLLVVYIVALRTLFAGASSILNALQITASFVPNFLLYLSLDPRMEGESADLGEDR